MVVARFWLWPGRALLLILESLAGRSSIVADSSPAGGKTSLQHFANIYSIPTEYISGLICYYTSNLAPSSITRLKRSNRGFGTSPEPTLFWRKQLGFVLQFL